MPCRGLFENDKQAFSSKAKVQVLTKACYSMIV